MTVPGIDVPPPMPPGAAGQGPVGYARPGTVRPAPPFDLQAFFTHLTCWTIAVIIFLVMTLFVVPRFNAIFMDFRLDLPLATKVLFTVCRWPLAVVPLLLLLLAGAGDSVAAGFWRPRSTLGIRRAYRLGVVFVTAVVALFVALAIFLPYVALIDAVSGIK